MKNVHTPDRKKGKSNKGRRNRQDKVIKGQLCFGSAMVGSGQKLAPVFFVWRGESRRVCVGGGQVVPKNTK